MSDDSDSEVPETPSPTVFHSQGNERQLSVEPGYNKFLQAAAAPVTPQPLQSHSRLVHASTAPASLPTPTSSPLEPPLDISPEFEAIGPAHSPPKPSLLRRAVTTPETVRSLRDVHHKLVEEGGSADLSEEDKNRIMRWSIALLGEVTKKPV